MRDGQAQDNPSGSREVGECGNGGNSSGPHLHYGLRGAPDPDAGMSIPAQFLSYLADGLPVRRGEPARGQKIRHAR
ncbi:MAG TPA: hypothetical protein VD861_20775 [Pyrinomonadaceae bacterium]|nr:hypothetical protein [Pyrinomonadaceae bacterium]